MYMTFGCSRSPVTVAVPNSSLSVVFGAFFWPGAVAAGRLELAPAAADEVSARGSPASDRAVALGGFADFAGAGAGAGGSAAACPDGAAAAEVSDDGGLAGAGGDWA
jgi:hypothetical protein